MLGHIGLYVENLLINDNFYRPLLQTIGYQVIIEVPQCVAYGKDGVPFFEIYTGKPKSSPIHIAFHVESKELVEQFHASAVRLGATDNGKPGYRRYFSNYYATFIIDPNGHNLEALYWGSDL